ncbi:MAG: ABC transporter ATP-binding protein [Chloroflexota bacterium]
MTAVELHTVSHSGNGVAILHDVTLTIPEGSAYGLVGANGSGKTTLLRVMASLIRPSAGKVRIFGHDAVTEPTAVRRLVGYVPDTFGSYPGLKVREYLEFFAGAHKLKHAGATIDDLLALMELQAVEQQYLSTLSRGRKQRLAIARALLHDPLLLLLDEPTFGLDVHGRRDILAILQELRHLGKTIVISSHLLEDTAQLVTDVAALSGGSIVAEATAEELRQIVEGPRRMRVEVANDPRLAVAALGSISSVRGTDIQGQEITFQFSGSRYALPDVVVALVQHDVKVIRFAEESNDLEVLLASLHDAASSGVSA